MGMVDLRGIEGWLTSGVSLFEEGFTMISGSLGGESMKSDGIGRVYLQYIYIYLTFPYCW